MKEKLQQIAVQLYTPTFLLVHYCFWHIVVVYGVNGDSRFSDEHMKPPAAVVLHTL